MFYHEIEEINMCLMILLLLPPVHIKALEGGEKGEFIASSVVNITKGFFSLGLENIQRECNEVLNKYLNLWREKVSTNVMTEYQLPVTYGQACQELQPQFLLFEPASIGVNILDSYHPGNPDTPALTSQSFDGRLNPELVVFAKVLDIAQTSITWKGSTSLETIVYHELLHICGDSPVLNKEVHDGVIRHTLIPTEALNNLLKSISGASRNTSVSLN